MKSSQSYKGIIYRVFNSGSQDKVIYLILEDGSKLACIAKSVKKAGSRKAHAIDIGNLVNIKVLKGTGLSILIEASTINEFQKWKKDFLSMTLLQLLCEVVGYFCYEENKDPEIYKYFYNALSASKDRQSLAVSTFLIKVLNHSGVLPELDKCLTTDQPLNSDNIYNIVGEVGYISDSAVDQNNLYTATQKIPSRIYKTQRFAIVSEFKDIMKIKLSQEDEKFLLNTHLNWLENLISVKIRSRDILNTIN